jgi:hypothetical protein
MTLEERMAFRRKMASEAVRSVLAAHGFSSVAYRMGVTHVDARGHRFAVMLELKPLPDPGAMGSWGEWQSMESEIVQTAAQRYRVGVDGVYWRLTQAVCEVIRSSGAESVAESEWTTLPQDPPLSARSQPSPPPPQPQPQPPQQPITAAGARPVSAHTGFLPPPTVSASHTPAKHPKARPDSDDGFPDTLLEARPGDFEGVTPEELVAFEEAIREGRSPQQPLKVGSRSYQTDYMPLG